MLPGVSVPPWLDNNTLLLMAVVFLPLSIAVIAGQVLRHTAEGFLSSAVLGKLNGRLIAWFVMCAVMSASFVFQNKHVVTVLFGLISFWALREFITLTPTRLGDHRALFWTFFCICPAQFILVGLGKELYPVFSIMIPVYAMLFIPARVAIAGDYKRFLERVAKIQAGLMICVYALSFAPALLYLDVTSSDKKIWGGSEAGLLFYFVLVVQLGDIFQYVGDVLFGRNVVAPEVNATRTWEGLIGSIAATALAGTLFAWATPFTIWEAPAICAILAFLGFAGSMTMSAIKRDRGVKDYGTLVVGHAGILDRMDSICFAAPVFFHIVQFFYTRGVEPLTAAGP